MNRMIDALVRQGFTADEAATLARLHDPDREDAQHFLERVSLATWDAGGDLQFGPMRERQDAAA